MRGCWHAPRTCPHMWTDCMRETAVRNPESDWTARMSACALTSRRVPCRPSGDTGRLAFTRLQRKFYYKPEDVERLITYVGIRRKEKAVREGRKNGNL